MVHPTMTPSPIIFSGLLIVCLCLIGILALRLASVCAPIWTR
jgi:hypothetical protein